MGSNPKPTSLTRGELYTLVWQTPMNRLAEQYGISGTGLAKICVRANVPYPPRGYWAKVEAGKAVRKTSLPNDSDADTTKITIHPSPPRPEPPSLDPTLQQEYVELLERFSALSLPGNLREPHPIVAGWIADRARRLTESKRDRTGWGLKVEPLSELDRRRHRISSFVFKTLESNGLKVKVDDNRTVWFEIGGERVDYSLEERVKQVRRPLRNDERHAWNLDQRWRQEAEWTGLLRFKIKTGIHPALRSEWVDDNADGLLESKVPEILAVLSLGRSILSARRAARLEAERKHQEAEMLRYEREREEKLDRNRWRRFLELADRSSKVANARQFIAALEASEAEAMVGGSSVKEWLAWAKEWADAYDPIRGGPEEVWQDIAEVTEWQYRD